VRHTVQRKAPNRYDPLVPGEGIYGGRNHKRLCQEENRCAHSVGVRFLTARAFPLIWAVVFEWVGGWSFIILSCECAGGHGQKTKVSRQINERCREIERLLELL